MMSIKGSRAFEKKLGQKKGSIDTEMGQSEMENELFEQSISKSSQPSKDLLALGKGPKEEEAPRKSFGAKTTLLPEDIQEILFNNNQVYVDKPLKEINKLFRDLKEARKVERKGKQTRPVENEWSNAEGPKKSISGLIDHYAEQIETCFQQLQNKVPPQNDYLDNFKAKIKGFFEDLKRATGKDSNPRQSDRFIATTLPCKDEEKEKKSLPHILDGSLENLMNQEKTREEECSILQGRTHSARDARPANEGRLHDSLFRVGVWAQSPRPGSLFHRMAANEQVYNELNTIKRLNFKLKEALSTYKQKKRWGTLDLDHD